MPLRLNIFDSIAEISATAWNHLLVDDNPLLKHAFLLAMENAGCVGAKFGWLPRHMALYQDDELIAAVPLYEKHNSYGEFVFDQSWAQAWERSGLAYYPKLVSAVPYTPAQGARLLARPEHQQQAWPVLMQAMTQLCEELEGSGVHVLFPRQQEQDFLQQEWVARHDCQFHWHNQNYASFDDFLARLTAKKRKNIRQERRKVEQAGITFRRVNGHTASERDLDLAADFYRCTFEDKYGVPTFNRAFFAEIANTMPDNLLLVFADKGEEAIAASIMYCGSDVLYGRHWGCSEFIEQLHFETCYYQGIEFCIENNIALFEPGAQGEHKIARGFLPTKTYSSHWIRDAGFRDAVKSFCTQELRSVDHYIEQLQSSTPYRQETP